MYTYVRFTTCTCMIHVYMNTSQHTTFCNEIIIPGSHATISNIIILALSPNNKT